MSGRTSTRCMAIGLLLCSAPTVATGPLPRVFFSPAERAGITDARLGAARVADRMPAPPARSAADPPSVADGGWQAAPPTATVRIEGVVLGSGVRAAAWIGGRRIQDGAHWGRYRLRIERDGSVLIADDGNVRRLRVGTELSP